MGVKHIYPLTRNAIFWIFKSRFLFFLASDFTEEKNISNSKLNVTDPSRRRKKNGALQRDIIWLG